ncbi:hypothetical protein [Streptomyces chattanoogensis]|uniref:hypothetical protein n=1 Tax=Streptomyces chattanoogensis TaxID=66876 RepID=UPI0036864974
MVLGMICASASAVCFGTASVFQAVAARTAAPGSASGVDPRLLLRVLGQWRYRRSAGPPGLRLAVLVFALAVLVSGAAAGRLPDRARAAVLGLGAGCGFGVVEVAVRLVDDFAPSALLTSPAVYALLIGGGAAFLLLTSAFQRGSVTTATAAMVIGETVGPALAGVLWLGDRPREGLAPLAVLGFALAVTGALALARFGEAPARDQARNTAPHPKLTTPGTHSPNHFPNHPPKDRT